MDQYTISILIPFMSAFFGVVIGGLITWKILKDQQIREWQRTYLESVWMPLMKEVSRNHETLSTTRFRLVPEDAEYKRISEENKDWVIGQPLSKDLADFYEFSFTKMDDQYKKIRVKGRELVQEMLPPGDTTGNLPEFERVERLSALSYYRFLGDDAVGWWTGFNWMPIHESDIITVYDKLKEPFKLDKSYEEFKEEFKAGMFSTKEWQDLGKEYIRTIEKADKLRIILAGIVGSYRRELELK